MDTLISLWCRSMLNIGGETKLQFLPNLIQKPTVGVYSMQTFHSCNL